MTMRTNYFLLLVMLLGIIPANNTHADNTTPKSVILYTPYTKISVSPGASIDYSVDLINNTDELVDANLSVSGLSGSWKYEMKSGGWNLSQLSVLPKEKKTFNLKVDVPLKVNKGSYHFVVTAGNTRLPLSVAVSQQGTYQTEFTTDQPNMQGNSKSTFTFSATLKNQTADQQLYALMANAPRGWNVVFKPNYKQATSAQVEANSSQSVSIDITPPANIKAGSYKIPVRAATGTTSAELELEVVVTGSYQMELTTPEGLLSADVTAGDVKRIELEVKNTGSSLLKDIQLSANKPIDWEVSFEPSKIEMLKAGETATVIAVLKASKKALPGDYVTTMMVKTPEINTEAQFRIAVKTPMIWGWVGVLIIIVSIGVVYYLFRKYGRR
ncbi:NEW3 domain-containing protein [Bacteroides sp.]|uniref:COG1470 family protein n=1 Tax=Bacteroides sp. TaxID=29523 RepID=UPI002622BF20|nr:NEW3 domain-containing protein [Bacteroides sp.]MDD3037658.1 NEW3 domain-containing protein [Bacteroides sp.]